MIILATITDKIQVVTGSALGMDVHASWDDLSGTTVTPGRTNTTISTAATTDVIGVPGGSTQRNVKFLSVRNTDTSSSNATTIQYNQNGTLITLLKVTLVAGDAIHYDEEQGFWVEDITDNSVLTAPVPFVLIDVTVLPGVGTTVTNGNFQTSLRTNNIRVKMMGGGGGGGGVAIGSSTSAAGGGGGGAGYEEKWFAVSPGTQYAYVIGGGGAGGTAGANDGTQGQTSTFTVGATTVTANSGAGGKGATAGTGGFFLGGGSSGAGTNGDINLPSARGMPGIVLSGTQATSSMSGQGGQPIYSWGGAGRGVNSTQAGVAGIGFGVGGGGAVEVNGAANKGGNGAPGLIVIEEYT